MATAAALASSTERETDKSTKYDDKPWKFQRVAVVNFAAWELYCDVKKAVVGELRITRLGATRSVDLGSAFVQGFPADKRR